MIVCLSYVKHFTGTLLFNFTHRVGTITNPMSKCEKEGLEKKNTKKNKKKEKEKRI